MKVAYDYQIFSMQKFGGISRYFCELSKQINLLENISAEILAPLYFNEYLKVSSENVRGSYIKYTAGSSKIYQAYNKLLSGFFLKKSDPTILHATYYNPPLDNKNKYLKIITVYDMVHEKVPDMAFPELSQAKRNAVNQADHVICISENTKYDLMEIFNVSPDKISVTHLGFNSFSDTNLEEKKIFDKPYVLYVGHRGRYKNFYRLLQAISESKMLKSSISLIAFGGGGFSAGEKAQIEDLGLDNENVVQISGSDATLANLYFHATAFIYPSLYEGFGIPILESMSCDCPVICSNASSFPEVAGKAARYFEPFDIDSIRCAIEEVVQSENLQKDLILSGRKQIEQFSWRRCALDTAEAYMNAVT